MDIGFIGLGNMGAHMARRLLEAGHKVVVYDTRQEAIGNLAALGAIAARSPAEVADAAEIVMASLPTPDVVLNVATGPSGVIEGKRVRRFVDLSTTGAVMAQRIFDMLRARNIVQIDSPVSGGVRGAEQGTLAVMVSGPRADVAAVEPALKVIGKIFVLGERPGARPDHEARQQRVVGGRDGGNGGSDGDRRQGRARSAPDARRHQCRHRAQHGDRRQIHQGHFARHVRSRLCRGPDAQGREAVSRRSANRSACRRR